MKKKMFNNVKLAGRLYAHNLVEKVSGPMSKTPGVKYITGSIDVATDDECLNIVKVFYTYVTPTNKNGDNPLYKTLMNIINGTYKNVMEHGADTALMLRVNTNLALREFYTADKELVSVKRNEGGFITVLSALPESIDERNLFDVDMVITNVRTVEGDPEQNKEDKLILKGAIFNFRNALLPVEFTVTSPAAMNYFESIEATSKHPVFTHLRGRQISEIGIVKTVEEGAFGEDFVRETQTSKKDFVVHWAAKEPYDFGDEAILTGADLKAAQADRESYLAELKARDEEYRRSKQVATTTTTVTVNKTSIDEFDF